MHEVTVSAFLCLSTLTNNGPCVLVRQMCTFPASGQGTLFSAVAPGAPLRAKGSRARSADATVLAMIAMHAPAATISAVVLLVAMHLPLITALHTATHKADSSSTISSAGGRRAASHAAPRAGVVHAHAVTSDIAGTSTHDERTPFTPSANRKSSVSPFGPTPAGCDAHIASATCILLGSPCQTETLK